MIPGQTSRSRAHHQRQLREQRIAEADAAARNWRDNELEHFVYRCYDKAGQLLYIGCTQDVDARMLVHQSSWQNPASAYLNLHMDRYEVEGPFVGRLAGRGAERAAIAAEAPLLNVHYNMGRGERILPTSDPVTGADRETLATAVGNLFAGTSIAQSA